MGIPANGRADTGALTNYCLSAKFGSLGRPYGLYKINKCFGDSLRHDFWNTIVPTALSTTSWEANVWDWVASSNPTGMFSDIIRDTTGSGATIASAMERGREWGIDDFSFIIWHSYSFSSVAHGGLAGQCNYCMACQNYIVSSVDPNTGEDGGVLYEGWHPARDARGTQEVIPRNYFDFLLTIQGTGHSTLDKSRDAWFNKVMDKGELHECLAYVSAGQAGALNSGADTGYS